MANTKKTSTLTPETSKEKKQTRDKKKAPSTRGDVSQTIDPKEKKPGTARKKPGPKAKPSEAGPEKPRTQISVGAPKPALKETVGAFREPFFKDYMIGVRKINPRSVKTYRKDYERFETFLGSEKPVKAITKDDIQGFLESPECTRTGMKPEGKPCAEPTRKKTVRLFKMWLDWLLAEGHIKHMPILLFLPSVQDPPKKGAKKKPTPAKPKKA